MFTVAGILNRPKLLDTLLTFESTRIKDDMARIHLNLDDSLLAQVQEFCDTYSLTRSKFLTRGVQLALDDARKRFGEAANEPIATQVAQSPPNDDRIKCIKRGDTLWFDMDEVCKALSIDVESLEGEIDPDDDVLNYAGTAWIDRRGVQEAQGLCRDKQIADTLGKWVDARQAEAR